MQCWQGATFAFAEGIVGQVTSGILTGGDLFLGGDGAFQSVSNAIDFFDGLSDIFDD